MVRILTGVIALSGSLILGCGSAPEGESAAQVDLKQKLLGHWRSPSGATLEFRDDGKVVSLVGYLNPKAATQDYELTGADTVKFGQSEAHLQGDELHATVLVEMGGGSDATVKVEDIYTRSAEPAGPEPELTPAGVQETKDGGN